MAEASENRVAVYIDFDNIVISRYDEVLGRGKFMSDKARGIGTPLDPRNPAVVDVGAIIDYATSFGSVVISRAFADWSAPANSRYSQRLVDRAVDLTQLFPTAAYQKNGADIRLSVDVVEDMFRLPDITHVVIVAGDSDFIPLAQRCKRLGRYVVGIGVAGATSKQLAAACNEFKFYGELPGVMPAVAPLPIAAATTAAPAKKTAIPKTTRTTKAASAATSESPADAKLSATNLLVRAMRLGYAKTDDEWLNTSSTKNQMLRMDPSFNEKSLGFKSFSDFLNRAARMSKSVRERTAAGSSSATCPPMHPSRATVDAASLVGMCRNIHTLHNFEPAANDEEVHAAALQYVRKISGATKPSKANEEAFERAVHEIAHITQHLLEDLVATTPPKDREVEAAKARARSALRFASTS